MTGNKWDTYLDLLPAKYSEDLHSGSLLRTPNGRLCVLDFGLMTQVTGEWRYTLIEYISHLMNSNYARVVDDLVRLGFVSEDRANLEETGAVVLKLTRVMSQLIQGRGVHNINVQQIPVHMKADILRWIQ